MTSSSMAMGSTFSKSGLEFIGIWLKLDFRIDDDNDDDWALLLCGDIVEASIISYLYVLY